MILAQLNARLMPFDRGLFFEDPLDAALRENGLGEIAGGGTVISDLGEPSHCEIEIEASPNQVQFVIDTLDRLGAPKGSSVSVEGSDAVYKMGRAEGIAVYLNGTDLPADVYESSDVNHVLSEFGRLLGTKGRVLSHWEGPTETGIYVYGGSIAEMQSLLADFIREYPLCRNCRISQIA